MRIVVDAFGGDNSPTAAVKGSIDFLNLHSDLGVEIVLSGDEEVLKKEIAKLEFSSDKLTILHAQEVISSHEQPSLAVKQRQPSVMTINMVAAKEADCIVSSGNTGALLLARF